MQLKQLSYLIAIVQSGSLSKASAMLGVAQPALSRQIRQLEQELGAPLFYRHGRGISPTPKGAQFTAAVEPVLNALLQAKADLRESVGELSGEIRLGLPPSLSGAIGAPLIRDFTTRFPRVKLHVLDGFSGFVNEWLVNGRVDMAVLNAARRAPAIRMDPLMTVDLYLVGRRDRLGVRGTRDSVPTMALKDIPLVLPGRHHGLRREVDAVAHKLGFELNTILEVDALSTLNALIHDGFGMGILPQGAIMSENRDPAVGVWRLVDPVVTQTFMLAFSLNRPITVAMRELTRAIRAQIVDALADGRMVGRLHAGDLPTPDSDAAKGGGKAPAEAKRRVAKRA